MREFFSQFGKVIDSTVMLDRETGRSKGFGFISLEDVNVQPFLGFGHLEIDGKLVRSFMPCEARLTDDFVRLTSNWRNRDINAKTSRRTNLAVAALLLEPATLVVPDVAVSTQVAWPPRGTHLSIPKLSQRSTPACSPWLMVALA